MNNQSENIAELASALSKAQGEYTPALKDSANPFFKSKYANLCSIVKACQEPLSKNGLSVTQGTNQDEKGNWILTTMLMHSSGQWIKSQTPIITLKPDIQSFGSASTYARRYAWASIAGVTTDEDDDAEAAMARDHAPKKQESKSYEKKSPAQVVAEESNVKPVYITNDEVSIFSNVLKKCPEEFQDNVWKYLNDLDIQDYKSITPKIYEKVMQRVKTKLEEMSKEK